MNNRIKGEVIVITGASSGLGEATARHLAAKGAHLVLGARRTDKLQAITKELRPAGAKVEVLTTDVTNAAQVSGIAGVSSARQRTFHQFGIRCRAQGLEPGRYGLQRNEIFRSRHLRRAAP